MNNITFAGREYRPLSIDREWLACKGVAVRLTKVFLESSISRMWEILEGDEMFRPATEEEAAALEAQLQPEQEQRPRDVIEALHMINARKNEEFSRDKSVIVAIDLVSQMVKCRITKMDTFFPSQVEESFKLELDGNDIHVGYRGENECVGL